MDYNSKEKHLKSLPTWVNFIRGKMTSINRLAYQLSFLIIWVFHDT